MGFKVVPLTGEQVAEVVDEASPAVDRDQAREVAEAFKRRGLAVVVKEHGHPNVDDLVAELERDPNIAIGEESALPHPWRRHAE
jgi:hypothetical protein